MLIVIKTPAARLDMVRKLLQAGADVNFTRTWLYNEQLPTPEGEDEWQDPRSMNFQR